MSALGIDAGASSTRWLLADRGGAVIASGQAAPISGHVFTPAAREAALRTLDGISAEVAGHGAPSHVVAGVTGLSPGTDVAQMLEAAIAERFALPRTSVVVVDDMLIAFRGAFEPGDGILVYAGTGSVAYHLTADGQVMRAGGHGFLVDDAGGGFWIGQQALRAMMRARDTGEMESALHRALCAAIGANTWDGMRPFVYGGGRSAVASLVPAVAAAASEGDAEAAAILRDAGRELARLARVLLRRLWDKPVALTGGAAAASPIIFAAFRDSLPAGVAVRRHEAPPVECAARLALAQGEEGA
jgi:N-acetylglucosamine kinase-like BadF-type ATPase